MSEYRTAEVRGLPRLYWLPAQGHGNGYEATSWAVILDVRAGEVAEELLRALADQQVAAYTAPAGGLRHDTFRIWVGSDAYGAAEGVLLRVLPELIKRRGESLLYRDQV